MKKQLRKLSLGIAVMMTISIALTGCGGNKKEENATSSETTTKAADTVTAEKLKEVKLKMYLLGDKPLAADEVYSEVNKKLKNDINATLDINFMGWADWDKKYDMLFASGEDFDLIYTSNWALYSQEAAKGGFFEITEGMLKEYAPKTLQNTPEVAWPQAKVNGKIYILPNTNKEFATRCLGIRGDLREKYGLSEIKTLDDYINYLDVIAKNEKGIVPLDIGGYAGEPLLLLDLFFSQPNEYALFANGVTFSSVGYKIGETKYENLLELPEFATFIKKMKEFKDKGYWSKNALNLKTLNSDSWKNGKAASAIWNAGSISAAVETINSKNPSWKPELVDGSFGKKVSATSYIVNGMGINANSKNPERSLMLLDLFKNDPEYYYLTQYGIKGKHYNLSEKQGFALSTKEGIEKYPMGGGCQWGWNNGDLSLLPEGGAPNLKDVRDDFIKRDTVDPLMGMSFNSDAIKSEAAKMQNVTDVYLQPLIMGFLDPVKGLEETKTKFKQAGIEKVLVEFQKQADDYIK